MTLEASSLPAPIEGSKIKREADGSAKSKIRHLDRDKNSALTLLVSVVSLKFMGALAPSGSNLSQMLIVERKRRPANESRAKRTLKFTPGLQAVELF